MPPLPENKKSFVACVLMAFSECNNDIGNFSIIPIWNDMRRRQYQYLEIEFLFALCDLLGNISFVFMKELMVQRSLMCDWSGLGKKS
jgi:hypothetical protein